MRPNARISLVAGGFLLLALGMLLETLFDDISGQTFILAVVTLGGVAFLSLIFFAAVLNEDRAHGH
jgi:hypothetical protein